MTSAVPKAQEPLFLEKTWIKAASPWILTASQKEEIKNIGQLCLEFYKNIESLYLKSRSDVSVLRNKEDKAPWVAQSLNKGKPDFLMDHASLKSQGGTTPMLIRPDLMLTEKRFVITEIDSVPGGLGLTASLYQDYGCIEGDAVCDLFYESLSSLCPAKDNPSIALVVSDESETYRPEMQWIARSLKSKGKSVYCVHPDDITVEDSVSISVGEKAHTIDIVYRFFELFDWENISCFNDLMQAQEEGKVVVNPPLKPFHEEKVNLALLKHPYLSGYWNEVGNSLQSYVPNSWIMDFNEVGPYASLLAPDIGETPLRSWFDLIDLPKKKRNWIMKLSGFHEDAWGARSVTVFSDKSKEDLFVAMQSARKISDKHPYILQDYHKPMRVEHPVLDDTGNESMMAGRMRICPYFVVQGDSAQYVGALATLCPLDKKIIHGMSDAALMPCI